MDSEVVIIEDDASSSQNQFQFFTPYAATKTNNDDIIILDKDNDAIKTKIKSEKEEVDYFIKDLVKEIKCEADEMDTRTDKQEGGCVYKSYHVTENIVRVSQACWLNKPSVLQEDDVPQIISERINTQAARRVAWEYCNLCNVYRYGASTSGPCLCYLRGSSSPCSSTKPQVVSKTCRVRTVYKRFQLDELEKAFSKSHYHKIDDIQELAHKINLTEIQVKIWFQNRRAKWRNRNEPPRKNTVKDLIAMKRDHRN